MTHDLPLTVRFGSEDPGAPVALAIHGITANRLSWAPVGRALGDRGALLAYDVRGRAASARLPGPYGFDRHSADIVGLLDAHDIDQAVLVGHSLGAYIATEFAVRHPERVASLVLADGGLAIPGTDDLPDPQPFIDAFLGPALARLALTFASRAEYHAWWDAHPALRGPDVARADLHAYADHDLVGTPPELRSSVVEAAVREDAAAVIRRHGAAAHAMRVRATHLRVPLGLLGEPNPMQPDAAAEAWAAEDPERRIARRVDGVNHYTLTLGAGASATADAVADALMLAGEDAPATAAR